MLHVPVFICA
jgi:hypothetical protein